MAKQQTKGARTLVIVCGIFFIFSAAISLLGGHLDKLVMYVVIAAAAFIYAATMKVKQDDEVGGEP